MRLLIKSRVKQPGKRGGKYWYDKHGNVQYGEKPNERQRKVQTKTGSRKPITAEEYKKHGVPEGAKHAFAYEKHDKYTHEWRDKRGKLQRKYQPKFVEQRQAEKYNKINNAADRIPELRESVNNDLNGKSRIKKYTALAVKIIDITGARVGTEKHTQEFDTHGITTLEKGNLIFKDDIAVLDYIGKKKVHQYHEIDDPEVVEALRSLKKLPGKRLFQIDNRGNISAQAVNKYLSDYGLTAKDLRTFRANVEFTEYLCQQGVKKDEKERKGIVAEALKTVAEQLGNTANVCRTNYVSPEILNGYLDGKISLRFAIAKGYDGKDYDEMFTDAEQMFLDIWSEIAGKKETGNRKQGAGNRKQETGKEIEKSHVKGHIRASKSGKLVQVKDYQNRKTKKTPITETKAFKEWFGNSKIVDKNGKPLVVYHGTKHKFTSFDLDKTGSNNDPGMWGKGFYFSPIRKFSSGYGDNIMRAYLSVKNPLIVKSISRLPDGLKPSNNSKDSLRLRKKLISMGYDGVIQYEASMGKGGLDYTKLTQIIAFSPAQIKSAIGNIGAFDPKDPDITKSQVTGHFRKTEQGRTVYVKLKSIRKFSSVFLF